MRKLTLELDALTVESFDLEAAAGMRRGTVHGNRVEEPIDWIDTMQPSCVSCANCTPGGTGNTCQQSCGATCGAATCADPSCRLSYCGDSCDGHWCASFISDYPAICP